MLDQLNPTELLIFAGLFIVETDELPKGDPKKVELLQAAHQLLERSSWGADNTGGKQVAPPRRL
jgi:hypothetical protein